MVTLKAAESTSIVIVSIYGPTSPWLPTNSFFNEPADLISALVTSSGQAVMACGDLNSHGSSPNAVDDRLAAMFDALNMT